MGRVRGCTKGSLRTFLSGGDIGVSWSWCLSDSHSLVAMERRGGGRFSKSDWGIFGLLGLGVLGNHLLVLFGLQFIGAGAAGVIIGASPAITAFLSSLILRDVPLRLIWSGCLVSFVGVVIITGQSGMEGIGSNPVLGGTLILSGLVSWALYTIGCRRTMDRFSPLTVTWTTLMMSLLLEIPLLAVNHQMLVAGIGTVPLSGWVALVYVMLFATALGQQAWLYGVDGVGPSRAGIFGNLIPVSALFFFFPDFGGAGWLERNRGDRIDLVWGMAGESTSTEATDIRLG